MLLFGPHGVGGGGGGGGWWVGRKGARRNEGGKEGPRRDHIVTIVCQNLRSHHGIMQNVLCFCG